MTIYDYYNHLICELCGKIEEFENEEIEKLQHDIAEENGFTLITHLMQLYDVCSSSKKRS